MTRIDDVSTNDMNFKHLDTAKDIVITPRNEFGGNLPLNTDHTWTAKVSDGNNYIGDYPVTIGPNGIVVNSAAFTKLPAGSYHLEIWEEWTDSNNTKQRSIYPSPQRTIDFTIYQNVTDLAEKEIKTIGFQDVVDQAVMNIGMNYVFKVNTIEPDQTATVVQAAADGKNYVTFNIPRGYKGDKGDPGVPGDPGERGLPGNDGLTPQIDAKTGHWMLGNLDTGVTAKGDKGDTGTVDNAGLTNAPAFQALQTQVADIKANGGGVNLAKGTSTDIVLDDTKNSDTSKSLFTAIYLDEQPKLGDVLTISAEGTLTGTGTLDEYQIIMFDSYIARPRSQSGFLKAGKRDSVTLSLDSLDGNGDTVLLVYAGKYAGTAGKKNVVHHLMVEEGTVAHDWSPNPSEILTQSDYAKIKAAIVALGGSLS